VLSALNIQLGPDFVFPPESLVKLEHAHTDSEKTQATSLRQPDMVAASDTSSYDGRMKSNPKATNEYTAFQSLLRHVVSFPKTEIQRMLKEEQKANQGKPKRGPKPKHVSSDHASDAKD
jgi:hypothetical protein